MKKLIVNACYLVLGCSLTSCTYLKYSLIQAGYSETQKTNPSQANLKRLIDQDTFFVFGKTIDGLQQYTNSSLAITAYSNEYQKDERVDTMFFTGSGTHYGLNLPAGHYRLQIYADINQDNLFSPSELIGQRAVNLSLLNHPEKVAGHIDIHLSAASIASQQKPIALPSATKLQASLFYPTGTIRHLADPLFDNHISKLGVYDSASFLEHAPTMFYALEENVMHKIPVVFVHGIDGSPRIFNHIIERIDRDRYTPWFFYYPSGGDLNQLADLFYRIFMSGNVIPLSDMPMIVVAHSMGGLVVREALNKYNANDSENQIALFVSIASPFGGHPAAAYGEKNGFMTLPVWQDLNPNKEFIQQLYRKPLPDFLSHQLFYAYKNAKRLKLTENSDGVVPLSSQLQTAAQQQAHHAFGFNDNHVDILENELMITQLLKAMSKVQNIFPEASLNILADGGFDIAFSDSYSPNFKHLMQYAGKYLILLAHERVKHPQEGRFIQAIQGKIPATTQVEKDFLRFMQEYPEISHKVLINHQH